MSHFLHSALVDQPYAKGVYFCSFVTKSNQACARYSPISVYKLFLLLSPHFSSLELSRPFQKINRISISSEKPPHTLFFCFKENSFFLKIVPFFPTLELTSKIYAIDLMFLLKRNYGFNEIIYK